VAANPGTVLAFLEAVIREHRRIAGDQASLQASAEKYIKETINRKTIGAAAKLYTDLKMYDINGGLTAAGLQYTNEFFGPSGAAAVRAGMTASAWADLILDLALKDLGKK
jgi:hypothetical protein